MVDRYTLEVRAIRAYKANGGKLSWWLLDECVRQSYREAVK